MVNNRVKFLGALFLITAFSLPAMDFGLIINQGGTFINNDNQYGATAIPWFAASPLDRLDVYLSAGIGAEYIGGEWQHRFEVYRTELSYSLFDTLSFTLGRQGFHDSLGLIMNGLFDGAGVSWNIGGGQLDLGVFYTGLLYKETASIFISQHDHDNNSDDDQYFASRRIAAGINWEKTSIFNTPASLSLSGIGQFDFNDADNKVHSQYLAGRVAFPFSSAINLELGGAFELLQETNENLRMAFAASTEIQYLFYSGIPGILALGGRLASGEWISESLGAFVPITGQAQGRILRPVLSGIALVETSYTARLLPALFGEVYAAYVFRTDMVSFISDEIDGQSDSWLLGAEIFLGLSWAPFSDLVLGAGGGVFFPQAGRAFIDGAALRYRVELTAGISL